MTDIPGLFVSITLPSRSIVAVSASGTQRTQGTGVCHVGYGVKINDTALGSSQYGERIQISSPSDGWWSIWNIDKGITLNAGTYRISIGATVATYDTTLEQMLNALAHLLDLAGVTARAIAGGNVLLRAGTAATPSLMPVGDPDTGVFFPSGDTMAMAVAGVERLRLDPSGYLGLGTTTPTGRLDVNDDRLRVRTAKTPASATATGNAGEVCWDGSYVYVCTSTNAWRRAALAAW